MNITIIAAIGKNNELGKDNELLWRIKEDLKFFKENTLNKKMIMGKNTLDSLPGLLPKRIHLVLTHKELEEKDNLKIFHSKESLEEYIESLDDEEIMVIGGAQIYRMFIDEANKMLITRIDDEKEADVFFPEIKEEEWDNRVLSEHRENNIKYKHLEYKRKK